LALALLAILIAADRLTAFYGHIEVTEGTAFDPRLVKGEGGPLHDRAFTAIAFVQGPFEIDYAPGMKRRDTRSRIMVPNGSGGWREEIVGDDKPLVLAGYRFYSSFNKGFAPVLEFIDSRGVKQLGAVHLPSYPLNHFKQGNDWQVPGSSRNVKLWLQIPEEVYKVEDAWEFALPKDPQLVVIDSETRRELSIGESLSLPDGNLRFHQLRSWMGYSISYNPLIPWIIAAVCLAVAALAWHGIAKMRQQPWDSPEAQTAVNGAGDRNAADTAREKQETTPTHLANRPGHVG
jgi:cytochrome c biogenesis protein